MPGPGNGRRHRGSAVRSGGEGMARVGVAAVQPLTCTGITPSVSGLRVPTAPVSGRGEARAHAVPAGPFHAYRGGRRPGRASGSPYDPGSRRFHG